MEGSLVPDESKVYLLEYDKFTFAYGEENPGPAKNLDKVRPSPYT